MFNFNSSNSQQPNPLYELHHFKKQIEEGRSDFKHSLFTLNRTRSFLYKNAFFFLATLFGLASIYIQKSYLNWTCILVFGTCETTKTVATLLCSLLSFLSLFIGSKVNPIDDSVNLVTQGAYRKAKQNYQRKKNEITCVYFCGSIESLKTLKVHKEHYLQLCETIQNEGQETLNTMKRVSISKLLSEQDKEKLYNQALFELSSTLKKLFLP